MAEPILGIPLMLVNRAEQVFPTLTEAQVARIAVHGRKRPVHPGEVLLDLGDQLRFFVVTKGKIDILSVSGSTESLIVTLTPGQFTGEVNLLSGRRGFTRIRATIHSKLRTQNAACPSIFPYVCCSINFRICGAGIAPAWRATSRPLRNRVIVGIAVIRKRAARLGTSSVFTFARTN